MIQHKTVTSTTNKQVSIKAETICLHGDGAHALEFAQMIYTILQQHHIKVKLFTS